MYRNLLAEMAREGFSIKDLALKTEIPERTLRDKMSGSSEWKWSEILKISALFPNCEMRHLFEERKAS